MSTLIDHHHLFKHRRPVESPKPADRPRRHGSRWLIAALAVSAAVVVTAIVAAQTGGESAQPAFQVPDLRGLDVIIYSGAPVNRAAGDTSAIQVPDLRGLDVIYSGDPVNRAASDAGAGPG